MDSIVEFGIAPHCGIATTHPEHTWPTNPDNGVTFECPGTDAPSIVYVPSAEQQLLSTLRCLDASIDALNATIARLTPYLDRMEAAMNRPAVSWLLGGKR